MDSTRHASGSLFFDVARHRFFQEHEAILVNCEIYNYLAIKYGKEGCILFTATRVWERAKTGSRWRREGSHHRLQGQTRTLKLLAADAVEKSILRRQFEVKGGFCWRLTPPLL